MTFVIKYCIIYRVKKGETKMERATELYTKWQELLQARILSPIGSKEEHEFHIESQAARKRFNRAVAEEGLTSEQIEELCEMGL